jgi:hypothetical protein
LQVVAYLYHIVPASSRSLACKILIQFTPDGTLDNQPPDGFSGVNRESVGGIGHPDMKWTSARIA